MKFRILTLLFICCFALTISFLGCDDGTKDITRPNGGGSDDTLATVRGSVTETGTENPIVGATIASDNGESTTSTDDGSYTFEILEGNRVITVTANNYLLASNTYTLDADSTYDMNFILTASPATITGQVTDSSSHAAIEGAIVAYDNGETATDQSGNFSIEVPAGTYTISVTAADFNPKEETVAVTPGQHRTINFSLALTNPEAGLGRVSGRITNRNDHSPIAGARVLPSRGDESATSNANGEYTIVLAPGARTLLARADGFDSEGRDVVVVAGEEQTLDITLRPTGASQMGNVQGLIIDGQTNAGIAGARIQAGLEIYNARGDGTYSISLLAGPYNFTVSATGYNPASGQVQVVVDQWVTANFTLTPTGGGGEDAGTLTGTISNASNGSRIQGARIICGSSSASSNAAGNYTLTVDPGNYTASVTANGFNSSQRNITIVANQTTTANFALTPGGGGGETGNITGTVKDASDNSGIYLALISCDGVTTRAGFSGEYTLQNVPVGNKTVTASLEGYTPESRGATVTADQTTPNINFSLTPTAGGGQCRITGTVKNSGGQGISGASVRSDSGESTSSSASGSFDFYVTAGNRTITASANGYRPQSLSGFCDTNRQVFFNFVLQQ